MTAQSPPQPTKTHLCVDGKLKAGSKAGRGANRCAMCARQWNRIWRERRREAKYANLPERGGVVGVVGLQKGNTTPTIKHGFYQRKLTSEESKLAEELHAAFMEAYQLDPLVDDLMLMTALSNLVKSLRATPPQGEGDHNVRDYQSFYERQFREIADSLSISRRQRKEETKTDPVADAIGRLFQKRGKKEAPRGEPAGGAEGEAA